MAYFCTSKKDAKTNQKLKNIHPRIKQNHMKTFLILALEMIHFQSCSLRNKVIKNAVAKKKLHYGYHAIQIMKDRVKKRGRREGFVEKKWSKKKF